MTRALAHRPVHEVTAHGSRRRDDALVVEEPLEVRLLLPDRRDPVPLSVTMRTPGHDFELVAGFLRTEGIVRSRDDIARLTYCVDAAGEQRYNVVNAHLGVGAAFDPARLARHHYMTSSCGVCGKASLEALRVEGIRPPDPDLRVDASLLCSLPDALRRGQALFAQTGGLHAAALFDAEGRLVVLREDVGRHNAVDKLVGARLLGGATALSGHILLVSGRASFEIMQKAAVAGVPAVCAVSAPSSLAVDLAREFGMILVGFLRERRFNVYSGVERVTGAAAPAG